VTFNDQIDIPPPLTTVTADTRCQAASALEGIGPRGMINLREAWLTGCGLIGRDGTAERLHRCLLLSDGLAIVGLTHPVELAGHAGSLLRLGVRTSTFGLGDDYNEELFGQMADAGGGACHDIAGAEGIQAALARELGDALEVVCADTRVRLTWQADIKVQDLGTWEAQPGPGSLLILPGDLVSEQVLDLLVEIRFPAGALDSPERAAQTRRPPGAGRCLRRGGSCRGGRIAGAYLPRSLRGEVHPEASTYSFQPPAPSYRA